MLQKISGIDKCQGEEREREGDITTFPRKFVVSPYRATSYGKLLFQKTSGIEKC